MKHEPGVGKIRKKNGSCNGYDIRRQHRYPKQLPFQRVYHQIDKRRQAAVKDIAQHIVVITQKKHFPDPGEKTQMHFLRYSPPHVYQEMKY